MELSEEAIQRLYKTMVEIIEDKYDVKIKYRVVDKTKEELEAEKLEKENNR